MGIKSSGSSEELRWGQEFSGKWILFLSTGSSKYNYQWRYFFWWNSSVPLVTSNSRILFIESVEGLPIILISSMISLIVFSNASTDSFDSETFSASLSTKLFNIWAS